MKRISTDSEASQREGVAWAVGGKRRQMRLGGPYAEDLEPASELPREACGKKPVAGESAAQACVKGMRDGRVCVNWGGTAGFSVPWGMEVRLFLCGDIPNKLQT